VATNGFDGLAFCGYHGFLDFGAVFADSFRASIWIWKKGFARADGRDDILKDLRR